MCDNLIFYNLPENREENTTQLIHQLLEDKLGMDKTRNTIKINRSYRLGEPKSGQLKPRPIVTKFNDFEDQEEIIQNAKKLKGTTL